jgi:copper chaperone CopZ
MRRRLDVNGMSCGHCAASVEKALLAVPGVREARVDLASATAEVEADEGVGDDALRAAVADAGYAVTDIRAVEQGK